MIHVLVCQSSEIVLIYSQNRVDYQDHQYTRRLVCQGFVGVWWFGWIDRHVSTYFMSVFE